MVFYVVTSERCRPVEAFDGVPAIKAWRSFTAEHIGCPSCSAVRPEWMPRPIDVYIQDPVVGTCGCVARTVRTIFRKDFLAELAPWLEGHIIGRVFLANGKEYDKYQTCYDLNPVVVRGSKESLNSVCKSCGTGHIALARPPLHVLEDAARGRELMQKHGGTMILSQRLVDQIDWTKYKDVDLEPVYVRRKPLDGVRLPGDPDWSTIPDEKTEDGVCLLKNLPLDDWYPARTITVDAQWKAAAMGTVLCKDCGQVDRRRAAAPIEVKLARNLDRSDQGLAQLAGVGLQVFNRSLLEALKPHDPGWILGTVRNRKGAEIEGFATCLLGSPVTLRSEGSGPQGSCGGCGAPVRARRGGPVYLEPPEGGLRPLMQAWSGELLIRSDVAAALEYLKWTGLAPTEIGVRASRPG